MNFSAADPWAGLAPATMIFNERVIDGIIRQPANAWTNIFYVIIAAVILKSVRHRGDASLMYSFSTAAFLVGVTSFLYHASNAFFFQFFDLTSMYLFSGLLISFNLYRFRVLGRSMIVPAAVLLVIFSSLLLFIIRGRAGAVIFGVEILIIIFQEIRLNKKNPPPSYMGFHTALALFLFAWLIWITDFSGYTFFSADNHFMQGHGLWHIINSLCFYYIYRFYREIISDQSGTKE